MGLKRTLELARSLLLAAALLVPGTAAAAPVRDTWWVDAARRPAGAAHLAVSPEAAMAHVEALAVTIGSRPADEISYRAAAEYARIKLAELGYQVSVRDLTYTQPVDLGSNVQLTGEERRARGNPLRGSSDGELEGELVFVGLARADDLKGRQLAGKIALAERGEITFSTKAENVRAAGAVGLVIYNNVRGPFQGLLGSPLDFLVLGVSDDEGARLRIKAEAGVAGARLTARRGMVEQRSANVVAHGGDPAAAGRILIGAHLDSVAAGPGANDNASGSAAVLELARVFAGRPERAQLSFALFGAEELGLIGSRRYVEELGAEGTRGLRAMVNLDMVAVGERFEIGSGGERGRELARQTIAAARELGYRPGSFEAAGGSDHASFAAAGVPAVMIHWREDPNYHQPTDTADKIDPEKLAISIRTVARLIETLLVSA